ncbi:DNA-binding protein [Paraburkholderia sp. RL18-103-BIB-C]|uniref:DNA-binding protein n=1 Tax=unclassified Paraburkholderia TaxID=2615204 RepID=UPI0038BC189A
MIQPTIPAEHRERIIAAAFALYEQNGKTTFPTVDAVRRAARVDMNAASSVMKEWRRAQTVQAAPVAVILPDVVQQSSAAALAAMWTQAQEQANESLRIAQAAWETERAELDVMRQEMADAYEAQASELEVAQGHIAEKAAMCATLAQEKADSLAAHAEVVGRAVRAEARIAEIEHRAEDLRAELDHAHVDAERLRAELADVRKQAAAEIEAATKAADAARADLAKAHARAETQAEAQAEQLSRAQTERDHAQRLAVEARESAAKLAGQLEATQAQNVVLIAAIAKPAADTDKG